MAESGALRNVLWSGWEAAAGHRGRSQSRAWVLRAAGSCGVRSRGRCLTRLTVQTGLCGSKGQNKVLGGTSYKDWTWSPCQAGLSKVCFLGKIGAAWRPEGGGYQRPVNRLWNQSSQGGGVGLELPEVGSLYLAHCGEGGHPGHVC